jgi:hypothetical protein
MLLEDNGYRVVERPRAGDVIVYRDGVDQIVHTGLVLCAFDDGQVLIESKWGIAGRYLHMAQDQYYSQLFSYYRSDRDPEPRGGDSQHLVQAVKVLPGNEIVPQAETAIVQQGPPADLPLVDEFENPMPVGAEYPLGAE